MPLKGVARIKTSEYEGSHRLIDRIKSKPVDVRYVSLLYDGGRSGSVFVQSLLDNHSAVITFPATLLIGGLSGTHFDNFFENVKNQTAQEIAVNFTKTYHTAFDSRVDVTACRLSKLGDFQKEYIKVSTEKFIEFFAQLLDEATEKTYKSIFLNAHLAWALAYGKRIDKKLIILHALHTPEDKMEMYCRNIPESKHLVCVRNPIPSHDSRFPHHIRRAKITEDSNEFLKHIENLNYPLNLTTDLLFAFKTIAKYANFKNVRTIRNEDLHFEPEKTVEKMCRFLEIEFEPQLLESTFFGLKHWGDDTIEPRNGFTRKSPSEFSILNSNFNVNDVRLIEDLIESRIEHYGYQRLTPKGVISHRRLNMITKWEQVSLFSILDKNILLANLAIYSRIFGANFHKLFIKVLSRLINESNSKIIIKWSQYVDMRVDLMKSYIAENKDNPEPKFGLI